MVKRPVRQRMERFTISIPADYKAAIKQLAKREGLQMADIMRRAVSEFLRKYDPHPLFDQVDEP